MGSYYQALADAREERANLPKLRALIDRREAQLDKMIESLEAVCEGAEANEIDALKMAPAFTALSAEGIEPGLQEACRAVIYAHSPTPLSATEIRDVLEASGFSTKNYSNPMATVHRALKRLHDDPDSCVTAVTATGKTHYLWVPPRGKAQNLYDKMIDPAKLKEAVYKKKPWMRPNEGPRRQSGAAQWREVPDWYERIKDGIADDYGLAKKIDLGKRNKDSRLKEIVCGDKKEEK